MTEIQLTNVQVANYIIDELYKDKPFDLILTPEQYSSFLNIAEQSPVGVGFQSWQEGECILVGVNKVNADMIYHMLSTHIAKHQKPENCIDQFIADGEFGKAFKDVFGLPESVVMSLGGVS